LSLLGTTEDGFVEITASGSLGYPVGMRFVVLGSAATYAIRPADWVLRLISGHPSNGNGKPWGEGVDCAKAELELAIALGLVHPSLVEEPTAPE
jgi:hypothetical protein